MKTEKELLLERLRFADLELELVGWFEQKKIKPVDADLLLLFTLTHSLMLSRPKATPEEVASFAYRIVAQIAREDGHII